MKYCALSFLLYSTALHADAHIHAGHCRVADGQVLVDMDAALHLPEAPLAAVKSGLSLHLVYDFRLQSDGRWWYRTLEPYIRRLSYNPISRQFILENPATLKRLSFANLNDALADIAHLRALPVLPAHTLQAADDYRLDVRLRLDDAHLPVALRLEVWRNTDWRIESDWYPCPLDR